MKQGQRRGLWVERSFEKVTPTINCSWGSCGLEQTEGQWFDSWLGKGTEEPHIVPDVFIMCEDNKGKTTCLLLESSV